VIEDEVRQEWGGKRHYTAEIGTGGREKSPRWTVGSARRLKPDCQKIS